MPSATTNNGPRSHESSGVVRVNAPAKSSFESRTRPVSDRKAHESFASTPCSASGPFPGSSCAVSSVGLIEKNAVVVNR